MAFSLYLRNVEVPCFFVTREKKCSTQKYTMFSLFPVSAYSVDDLCHKKWATEFHTFFISGHHTSNVSLHCLVNIEANYDICTAGNFIKLKSPIPSHSNSRWSILIPIPTPMGPTAIPIFSLPIVWSSLASIIRPIDSHDTFRVRLTLKPHHSLILGPVDNVRHYWAWLGCLLYCNL